MEGLLNISDQEFRQIADLVYQRFGINLGDKKKVLVRGRLNKLLRAGNYTSFNDYYEDVLSDASGKNLLTLIDKISTNHSFFYREADHFEYLSNHILPELTADGAIGGSEDFRLWCAGCAAGEEPYTLAMVLREYFPDNFFTGSPVILATDISMTALETAVKGKYTPDKVKGLPEKLLKKYLTLGKDGQYEVKDTLKKMILFKRLNFKQETFPFKSKFQVVFCRNVMIYFDQETKLDLAGRIGRHIVPGGYFLIGHSESLGREMAEYQYIRPAVYRKR